MVLGRSQSIDSGTSNRRLRDSSLTACTELLLGTMEPVSMSAAASSAAVAAALSVDLAAVVAGSVSSVPTANKQLDAGVLELSQSGESAEVIRHMPHHWMKSDVAATIRNIHNNKKATIRQHYYPEGMGRQMYRLLYMRLGLKTISGI